MTNCDLILVPVNPDVFADRGLNILLEGLIMILHPHPLTQSSRFHEPCPSIYGQLHERDKILLGFGGKGMQQMEAVERTEH